NIANILSGKSTSDKLIGADLPNTWDISSKNAGDVNGVNFTSFENLVGGFDVDSFVFEAGASITGKIDGGAGASDTLDYSAFTTPVTVNLQSKKATAISGGYLNIEGATGGAGNNYLTAANKANAWTLAGTNSGLIDDGLTTFSFASFAN